MTTENVEVAFNIFDEWLTRLRSSLFVELAEVAGVLGEMERAKRESEAEQNDGGGPAGLLDVYIVFDNPPGPDGARFVEVEDEEGRGVGFRSDLDAGRSPRCGQWRRDADGKFWRLGPLLVPETDVKRDEMPERPS